MPTSIPDGWPRPGVVLVPSPGWVAAFDLVGVGLDIDDASAAGVEAVDRPRSKLVSTVRRLLRVSSLVGGQDVLWLAGELAAAGASVRLVDGWQTRATKRALDVRWVVCHHTASVPWSTDAANTWVVVNGNAVAPGPIAQLLIHRAGVIEMIAAGAANNAGAGTLPDGRTDGNAQIGIEVVNAGAGMRWAPATNQVVYGGSTFTLSTANRAIWERRVAAGELVQDPRTGLWWEVWAEAQLVAYATACAVICDHYGWGPERLVAHAQYAPTRKVDPAGPWFDHPTVPLPAAQWMTRFRELTQLILDGRRTPPPIESPSPVEPPAPTPSPIPPFTEVPADMNVIMRCTGKTPVHLVVEAGKVTATGLPTPADERFAAAAGAKDIAEPVSDALYLDWVTKALVSMGWGRVVGGAYVAN